MSGAQRDRVELSIELPRAPLAFAIRTAAWLAYLLPLACAARLFAVLVHEVLGHGLTSLATGGRFDGVRLDFDGSASAFVSGGHARNVVLASGIAAQVLLGLACVLVSARASARPISRAAWLVLALNCFHDALPYGLWGAWLPTPEAHADVARILVALRDPSSARATTTAGFAIAYVSAVSVASWLLLRVLERDLGPLTRVRRAILAGAFTVSAATAYFAFDWTALVPRVGAVPAWSATVLQLAISVAFVMHTRPVVATHSADPMPWRAAIAWSSIACVLWIAAVALWFREGVRWG